MAFREKEEERLESKKDKDKEPESQEFGSLGWVVLQAGLVALFQPLFIFINLVGKVLFRGIFYFYWFMYGLFFFGIFASLIFMLLFPEMKTLLLFIWSLVYHACFRMFNIFCMEVRSRFLIKMRLREKKNGENCSS